MPDSALISVLSGSGVAGVFCVLFITGLIYPKSVVTDLKEENAELKQAVAAERDRADTAVATAQSARDLMAALQAGIRMAQQTGPPGGPAP
jgi:Na+-transporting methylmalonyl-CoA/oxaloacetate decarboxylase gamma subunit